MVLQVMHISAAIVTMHRLISFTITTTIKLKKPWVPYNIYSFSSWLKSWMMKTQWQARDTHHHCFKTSQSSSQTSMQLCGPTKLSPCIYRCLNIASKAQYCNKIISPRLQILIYSQPLSTNISTCPSNYATRFIFIFLLLFFYVFLFQPK